MFLIAWHYFSDNIQLYTMQNDILLLFNGATTSLCFMMLHLNMTPIPSLIRIAILMMILIPDPRPLCHKFQSSSDNSDASDDKGFSVLAPSNDDPTEHLDPIRPAVKPKKGAKRKNVFVDDRGFPDLSDEYDTLLQNIDGGTVVRKWCHPARPLDEIVNVQYNEFKHGEKF
jgi:hypothetical protein